MKENEGEVSYLWADWQVLETERADWRVLETERTRDRLIDGGELI